MKRVLGFVVVLLLLLLGAAAFLVLGDGAGPQPEPAARDPDPVVATPRREPAATRRTRHPTGERTQPDGSTPVIERAAPEPGADPVEVRRPPGPGASEVGRLVVTVTREDGSPVRGATVALFAMWGRMAATPGPAETDADGHVRMDLASRVTFRLRATKGSVAALGPRISVDPGAELEQILVVTPARVVEGRVVEQAGGAPVAGAHVTASLATDDPFGLRVETESAPDGSFELPAVPESYFAAPVALTVTANGYVEHRTGLEPGEGDEPLLVELGRGVVVRGRCLRVGAVPVPGVTVTTHGHGSPSNGETDADGRFELLGVAPDLQELLFRADDLALERVTVPPTTAREIDVGDVLLDPGLPVRGIVVDGDGKPLVGASVILRHEELRLEVRHAATGEDGRFRLDAVGEGAHVVVATEPNSGKDWSRLSAAVVRGVSAGGDELRIVVTGKLSLVVVFLLESDRSPISVAEVKIEARHRDSHDQALGMAWAGGNLQSVRAHFEQPGLYDVTISLPGYVPATLDAVEIFPDREARIEALLRRVPE